MASAYTIFANLGEASSPIAINRVTNGDGHNVVEPKTEKKKVLRPDVAYIMDDMMKDVINRGTAAEAKAWGFKNVAGKTGIRRKNRNFARRLVCRIYAGTRLRRLCRI